VGKADKVLETVLRGTSEANIPFRDLCKLRKELGFTERVRGDHFIYTKPETQEMLNVQPIGALAKVHKVKQVRNVIVMYKRGASYGG